jgi:hypothetical protein
MLTQIHEVKRGFGECLALNLDLASENNTTLKAGMPKVSLELATKYLCLKTHSFGKNSEKNFVSALFYHSTIHSDCDLLL